MALHVTVVYSPGARVVHERSLVLPDGATVEQALDACGWRGEVGQSGEGVALLGVWGRKVTAQQLLRDHALHHLQHRRDQLGLRGQQQPQRDRQREHPLAHRHLRDDVIQQVGGRLRHAPRAA